MPSSPTIVLQESNFIAATLGVLVVAVVDGLTAPEQMDSLATQMRASARLHAGGIAFLFIIRDSAALPPTSVRQRFEKMMREMQGKLKLLAVVIEGSGFASAAKRSVFTMISAQIVGKISLKVFAASPKACAWLAGMSATQALELPPAATLAAFAAGLPATRSDGA